MYLLVTIHLVGLFGIANESSRVLFLKLTPLSLIFSASIVIWFHTDWNRSFILFIAACYLIGITVEMIGVNTGLPFGDYRYGSSLGIEVLGTPLLIGLNWVLLIYCTGALAERVISIPWVKIWIGSILMVFIDLWMEPVAPGLDFWSFENGYAPVINFVGWFFTSIGLHWLFQGLQFNKTNTMAIIYLAILTLFFISLNFLVK